MDAHYYLIIIHNYQLLIILTGARAWCSQMIMCQSPRIMPQSQMIRLLAFMALCSSKNPFQVLTDAYGRKIVFKFVSPNAAES